MRSKADFESFALAPINPRPTLSNKHSADNLTVIQEPCSNSGPKPFRLKPRVCNRFSSIGQPFVNQEKRPSGNGRSVLFTAVDILITKVFFLNGYIAAILMQCLDAFV
ncbi:hypothetical protein D3C76_1355180 [compost metagenome]